jgi:release factor glutamine methyltransferase
LSGSVTTGGAIDAIADRLRSAGSVYAEDETRLLVEAAHDAADLDDLVRRRVDGEPLEYIVGWAEFCGLRIRVQPGVFVPRRRTEFLVQRAADLATRRRHPLVIDLCCGSGAIGAALATRVHDIELYATDIDATAVACARDNLHGRGTVTVGDLFAPVPANLCGRVDVVVANAPYVPTAEIRLMPREARLHETLATLDGGSDGLDLHRRISAQAPEWLTPGGHLLIESSEHQAERTAEMVTNAGLDARIERSEDATIVIGALAGA